MAPTSMNYNMYRMHQLTQFSDINNSLYSLKGKESLFFAGLKCVAGGAVAVAVVKLIRHEPLPCKQHTINTAGCPLIT